MVAFVGAGGKTTAAWRLLRLLVESGERVVFTTTTRIFEPRERGIPLLLAPEPDPAEIERLLARSPALVLAAGRGEEVEVDPAHPARSPYAAFATKLVGLAPDVLSALAQRLPGVTWPVEADGAKGRLLKAPAEYEPVLPAGAERVVVVAGLEAIGRPLDERTVHRPEIAARLLGLPGSCTKPPPQVGVGSQLRQARGEAVTEPPTGVGGLPGSCAKPPPQVGVGSQLRQARLDVITPAMVATLLGHQAGGLKGIPPQVQVVVLLTQWGDALAAPAGPGEMQPEARLQPGNSRPAPRTTDHVSHPHAEAIARQLLSGARIGRVVLANLRAAEPVLKMWEPPPNEF
jgi:probable selenium-dependent hydroxylase accessory protein YqeC